MAQAYMKNPTPIVTRLAAIEVRQAIEGSFYSDFELGQDQIEFLRRVEKLHTGEDAEEIVQEDERSVVGAFEPQAVLRHRPLG